MLTCWCHDDIYVAKETVCYNCNALHWGGSPLITLPPSQTNRISGVKAPKKVWSLKYFSVTLNIQYWKRHPSIFSWRVCIHWGCVDVDQTWFIVVWTQIQTCHPILFEMLLNSDWCPEICSPAHYRPLRRALIQWKIQNWQKMLRSCKTSSLIVRSWLSCSDTNKSSLLVSLSSSSTNARWWPLRRSHCGWSSVPCRHPTLLHLSE